MKSEYLEADNTFNFENLNKFSVETEELIESFQNLLAGPSSEEYGRHLLIDGNRRESENRLKAYDQFTQDQAPILVAALRKLALTVTPKIFIEFLKNWSGGHNVSEDPKSNPLGLAIKKITFFLEVSFEKLLTREFTIKQTGAEYDEFVGMLNRERRTSRNLRIDVMISEVVAEAYEVLKQQILR